MTATSTSATGTYLINFVASHLVQDTSGNRYQCGGNYYDGMQVFENGQQSNFTGAGKVTLSDQFAFCGTQANNFTDASGRIVTTYTYDSYGNQLTTTDPDANAGIAGHTNSTTGSSCYGFTACTTYDTTFHTLPISTINVFNQTTSTGYTQTAAGGFGLWPTSTTDVNGQVTSVAYDALGRQISQTLPGETTGLTTTTLSYSFSACSGTGPQQPCVEVDQTERLNSTTTVTTRAFYDGYGRLVETRSPGPPGQDVVQHRYYDPSGRVVFESVPYLVTAYAGVGSTYYLPDSTQPGTSWSYTSLLSSTVTDPLSHTWNSSSSVVCSPPGVTDSACYVQDTAIDPLGHKQGTLTDALGRAIYVQQYTGNSPATYAVYTTTKYTYNYLGNRTQIVQPDGVTTTTYQFDMLGRRTGVTDPDRGTESDVYDPNGNVTQTVDARGTAGTIFAGYDGLNRQLWRNTTNSPTGAYVTYSYDSTANGNQGVGRLTGETFTGGPNQSLSGSYSFVYDGRGQTTQITLTVGGTPYLIQMSYDDAGDLLSKTYPNGDVLTTSYTSQGWLAGLTLQQGSTQTTLLSNLSYTGTSGAAGLWSSASLNGGTYTRSQTYDLLLRLTDTKVTRSSDQATLFEEALSYDNADNVTGVTTTLPPGTDVQQFCYDDLNRLTWAGAVGIPPCTGTAITPGTLTSAQYTHTFTYDTLGRLTSGPLGTYTYGNSAHKHAPSSIGSSYTAYYDAVGNMTCRSTSSTSNCTGMEHKGNQLSYDNEGRLSHWQDLKTSPTSQDDFLYDGEGHRVEQKTTAGGEHGTTTTTVYVGDLEEISTTGTTTTTTTSYGKLALAVNGVLSYLVTDALGSISEALDTSGNVQASTLYGPYGLVRYSSGTMPGTYGFTGQHADSTTGLDYFNARYYDPTAGIFSSADTILPGGGDDPAGLNSYGYVAGNPETYTDPSGHCPIIICVVIPILVFAAAATVVSADIIRHQHPDGNLQGFSAPLSFTHHGMSPDTADAAQQYEESQNAPRNAQEPDTGRQLHERWIPDVEGVPVTNDAIGEPLPGSRLVVSTPPIEAEKLPVHQKYGKTDCVLELTDPNNGNPIGLNLTLQSGGVGGPGHWAQHLGFRGFGGVPGYYNSHCEAHAIALMLLFQWPSANLWINNPPCQDKDYGCDPLMTQRLPPGWKLNVYVGNGKGVWTPWKPPGYVGNPR